MSTANSFHECELFGCQKPPVNGTRQPYCKEHVDPIGAELAQFRWWLTGFPGNDVYELPRPDEATDRLGRFDVDRVTL